jgi:cobalt/nickel transport system ATP-binding protein
VEVGVSAPAIRARDLDYTYPDGRRAVRSVGLEIGAGEAVGLIGPNGAGKTTLLLLLAGLLRPQRGEVTVFGNSFEGAGEREARRRVGFVFQETEDQLFSPTVFDDVAFGILNFAPTTGRIDADGVRGKVAEALRQVGLTGYEDRVPHHLSCGERRRVALATVLSYEPEVLVLDEPSNDLDPRGRRELAFLLRTTAHARLVASHDMEFVLRTCDRVLILNDGAIRADGGVHDVLCDTALLESHGLEIPLGLRGLSAAALRELIERERNG